MSQHIPQALLKKFVAGDLQEPVAVAVAQHIDSCSRCSSEAAAADPLNQAFASTSDPPIPEDLVEKIQIAVAAAPHEEEQPARPLLTSRLFLIAAAVLLVVLIAAPSGILEHTTTAVHTAANQSEENIGRGGSVGMAIGFFLGVAIAAVIYRNRKTG